MVSLDGSRTWVRCSLLDVDVDVDVRMRGLLWDGVDVMDLDGSFFGVVLGQGMILWIGGSWIRKCG